MKHIKRFAAMLCAAVALVAFAAPAFAEGTQPASTDTATELAQISDSLDIMGKGMLGIFIVMGIILILILVLNAATKPRKKKEQ